MNINDYPITIILQKILTGELPTSTFSLIHDNEKEKANETVLFKYLYMYYPFKKDMYTLIKNTPFSLEILEKESMYGWNPYRATILNGDVDMAAYLLKQVAQLKGDFSSHNPYH